MEKTLVVIGASSDMGTALIEKDFALYGCIVAHYRNKNERLSLVMEKASEMLGRENVLEIKCDFSSQERLSGGCQDIENDFHSVAEKVKGTEIHLVHFAAPQCYNNRFHKISWEVFQNEIDISLRSFVIAAQAFLPIMSKVRAGRIVVMLSYLAENIPPKFCANYITVKYALLGLMKALAVEYADKGITVNGVSPAHVETKYISNQPEIIRNGWIEKSPIGRYLSVDDVLPTISFLLSDQARCINGENILVSCGMAAQ